jgi:Ca2+/Na+ antiporter
MNAGLSGGILGGIIGIIGGLIGTFFSIKNTNGPKEKAFMIKSVVILWVAIIVFLALFFCLPKPYNFLLWIPYIIALPIAILHLNRRQREIREIEKKK